MILFFNCFTINDLSLRIIWPKGRGSSYGDIWFLIRFLISFNAFVFRLLYLLGLISLDRAIFCSSASFSGLFFSFRIYTHSFIGCYSLNESQVFLIFLQKKI